MNFNLTMQRYRKKLRIPNFQRTFFSKKTKKVKPTNNWVDFTFIYNTMS